MAAQLQEQKTIFNQINLIINSPTKQLNSNIVKTKLSLQQKLKTIKEKSKADLHQSKEKVNCTPIKGIVKNLANKCEKQKIRLKKLREIFKESEVNEKDFLAQCGALVAEANETVDKMHTIMQASSNSSSNNLKL